MSDPTQRFSDRVETYVRARPGYPSALIGVLRDRARPGPSGRREAPWR